jgi:hypothetical protein
VDLVGIEPTTSSMPWHGPTPKLLIALAALAANTVKNRASRRFVTPN